MKVKLDIPAQVEAYRMRCAPHVREMWDAADTKYVENLYRPRFDSDEDEDSADRDNSSR